MTKIYLILYILSAVSFLIALFWGYAGNDGNGAGAGRNFPVRVNLLALGLLLWVLVPLIQTARVV